MTKSCRTVAVFFLVLAGPGIISGSAAADPVESDTFKFTWLGVPIGEVTLHYGSYEDPKHAFGLDPEALTGTPARKLERQSRELPDGEHKDRESVQSLRLGALEGRTNGLVRWLKRYEGAYRTTLTPGGSRYEVTAMDQGVPETRDIWFGAKHTDTPQVLDFRDRSTADPLQPLTGVDDGSVDPVRLMATILKAIESHNGCPGIPEFFRVFDGKRRYEARLSNPNWMDASGLSAQAGSNVALKVPNERDRSLTGSGLTSSGGLSESGSEVGAVSKDGAASAPCEKARGERVSDQDRCEFNMRRTVTSVAQKSEELMDRAPRKPVPHTLECRLTLAAREVSEALRRDSQLSEFDANGKLVPAGLSGQNTVDQIDQQNQTGSGDDIAASSELADSSLSLESAEARSSARETRYEKAHQDVDLTTQQSSFWPFSLRDLAVDFSVELNSDGAMFRSFLIRVPAGQVKGKLANKE